MDRTAESDERRIAELTAAVEDARGRYSALQEELEETNRGVVALYAELDSCSTGSTGR